MGSETSQSAPTTFLFTDLESSTRLWEENADAMAAALAEHDSILREAVARHRGRVFATGGDGFAAVFASAVDAVAAAGDAQRELRAHEWPAALKLRVRIGLNTGVAHERDGDYFGPAVNRAARIMAAAHGAQVLLSATTKAQVPGCETDGLGSHRLRDLFEPEDLYQLVVDGDRGAYPPVRSIDVFAHNLPAVRTALFGRAADVDRVLELLETSAIVTLTGVGGVGKTRLALEVASRLVGRFDIVCFVDGSCLTDEVQVPVALATALDLPAGEAVGGDGMPALRMLHSRRSLVVLDNCEHLVDAFAEVVSDIARHCPQASVLATSREPLGIDSERVFRVPSLDTEAASALFEDRAAAVTGEAIPGSDLDSVAEICERLDGIPLAVELAAVRASHLAVQDIAAHLDERFRLLTGRRRNQRQRQQTLQATMDWSYDLLDDDERRVLRSAGVFVGGFALDALEAVSGTRGAALIGVLGSLVAKSLIDLVPNEGGPGRYRLLETVRLYSLDRLVEAGEAERCRASHADWYRSLLVVDVIDDAWYRFESLRPALPDIENHMVALDWVAETGDLARLGSYATALEWASPYGLWVDPARRYLQRDDVVESLATARERWAYRTASATNANAVADFAAQQVWAEAAMQDAPDLDARLVALGLLTNALAVFDPGRAQALVQAALPDCPAGRRRDSLLARQLDALLMAGRLEEGLGLGVELEPRFAGWSEMLFVDHTLGLGPWSRPGPVDASMAHRLPLRRALDAAVEGDVDAAARHLLEGAAIADRRPLGLIDRDVLLVAAAIAWHAGDERHAARLLAVQSGPGRGLVRTPGAWVLYVHYRGLARDRFSSAEVGALRAETASADVTAVLRAELDRFATQIQDRA